MSSKKYLGFMAALPLVFSTASGIVPIEAAQQSSVQNKTLEEMAKVGEGAPNFTLKNLDDRDRSLQDYKSKVVVVTFWSMYCNACKEEMPSLQQFANEYKGKDLEVVTIHCLSSDKKKIKDFMKKNGYTLDVLIDNGDKVAGIYGIEKIPTTFILDKDKKILKKIEGRYNFTDKEFKSWIDGILQQPTGSELDSPRSYNG